MSDEDGKTDVQLRALTSLAIREGARIMGALATIVGVLWLFGQSVFNEAVNDVIDDRHLTPVSETVILKDRIVGLENRVERNGDAMRQTNDAVIGLQSDVTSVKELLTEQRQDIKSLLRSLAAPRNPDVPQ